MSWHEGRISPTVTGTRGHQFHHSGAGTGFLYFYASGIVKGTASAVRPLQVFGDLTLRGHNPRTANHARVFFSSGGPSAPGRRFPLKAGEAKVRCTYMARRDVGPRFVTPCSTPHISAGCVPQNRGPTG